MPSLKFVDDFAARMGLGPPEYAVTLTKRERLILTEAAAILTRADELQRVIDQDPEGHNPYHHAECEIHEVLDRTGETAKVKCEYCKRESWTACRQCAAKLCSWHSVNSIVTGPRCRPDCKVTA